ncbi:hypothetical protein WMY93_000662 [Mugilogobius chulae]|uniref:G-protein coupled receptors family 2 profile 2 domain-containing protein n=1 Tax=Mugilogobius chulae TaxID=88201 RepID=A0AAW0PZX6_9GOBI
MKATLRSHEALHEALYLYLTFDLRRLHCTRNSIHLNLFLSFIFRAVAVLLKDQVLFSRAAQCSPHGSLVGCRASLLLLQYFILANFSWLLVEGLYLHTLLLVILSESWHFRTYLFMGWGVPCVLVCVWAVARLYLEDTGCWETNDHPVPHWLINGPIVLSVLVNFILFIRIVRVLMQKLQGPDVGGHDQSQFRRLAKSTLLLIPLFGIHYIVFVSLSESVAERAKIFFDLALGSFQGFVVAILYCFLNSEVQTELRRTWRSLCLTCALSRDLPLTHTLVSRTTSGPRVREYPTVSSTFREYPLEYPTVSSTCQRVPHCELHASRVPTVSSTSQRVPHCELHVSESTPLEYPTVSSTCQRVPHCELHEEYPTVSSMCQRVPTVSSMCQRVPHCELHESESTHCELHVSESTPL